jgi:hypothetical protein
MTVSIDANANVIIDGVSHGHVLDAMRGAASVGADIKAAFDQAWLAQMVLARDAQAAAQASIADAIKQNQQALAAQSAANTAAQSQIVADYSAQISQLQQQIDSLGGTDLAKQMAKEKALADAQAALDAAASRVVEAQQALGTATVTTAPLEATP